MNDGLQHRKPKARAIALRATAEDAQRLLASQVLMIAAAAATIVEAAWLARGLLGAIN